MAPVNDFFIHNIFSPNILSDPYFNIKKFCFEKMYFWREYKLCYIVKDCLNIVY